MRLRHPRNVPRTIPFEVWAQALFENNNDSSRKVFQRWEKHPAAVRVGQMALLLERHAQVFAPYSDKQVAEGLWSLSTAEYARLLLAPGVSPSLRQRYLDAIFLLFEQCFAKRCPPPPLDNSGEAFYERHPLNLPCEMWWDNFQLWGGPDDPARAEVDQAALMVMHKILSLDSEACRLSALHGLGHWADFYPEQVHTIIDAFLREADAQSTLRPELKHYAQQARMGHVQ